MRNLVLLPQEEHYLIRFEYYCHLKTQFTVCTYRWFIGKITTLSNIEIIEALPLGGGENAADQGALNSVFAFLTDLVKCIYNSTLKSQHATRQKKKNKKLMMFQVNPDEIQIFCHLYRYCFVRLLKKYVK